MNISMESLSMMELNYRSPADSPRKRWKHPDIDHGWAWAVMIAAFFIQFAAAGTIMCYGVLYVEFLDYFGESRASTSWIGSLNITTFSIAGFIASVLSNKFSHRVTIIVGSLIATLGLIISVHCPNIYFLYLTYGIIAGLGMGLVWVASISIVTLYFKKRRSFAVGFSMCGGGVGFLVFPKLMDFLIQELSWRGALYITGGLWLNGCICGMISKPLSKVDASLPNREHYEDQHKAKVCESTLARKWTFYLFCVAQVFWNVGLILFLYILPDFARLSGHGKEKSGLLLSILGAVMLPARILAGLLADHKNVDIILFMTVITTTMGVVTAVFPMSTLYPVLGVLTAIMGLCQGVVIMGVPLICVEVFGPKRLTSAFGYLQAADGLGCLVAPPLAGYAYDMTGTYTNAYIIGGVITVGAGLLFFVLFLYARGHLCREAIISPSEGSPKFGREIIPLTIPKIKINDESPDPDDFTDPGFKREDTNDLSQDLNKNDSSGFIESEDIEAAESSEVNGSSGPDEPAELEITEDVETVSMTQKMA
ncbi:monocarboxylate transporter 12-like [Lineus longissimus]|uniref:monocarboxylate transporter 12-like n=1 Tax=Lineus longissimus TaxID=88925 RepID=UPI002B4CC06D